MKNKISSFFVSIMNLKYYKDNIFVFFLIFIMYLFE